MAILQNVLVGARAIQAQPPVVIPAGAAAFTLSKAFSPATIAQGGTSTLTPSNTNGTAATPPAGLVVSGIASPAGMTARRQASRHSRPRPVLPSKKPLGS